MSAKIKCKKCGKILESKHRHDFQMCDCGTYVDGGNDPYVRYGANDLSDVIIINEDGTEELLVSKMKENERS